MFKYPYTNEHELNLDWLIEEANRLRKEWNDFQAIHTITYEGEWNIEKSYEAWCVVKYQNNGYISLKAVPAGVHITNEEYWTTMIDYSTEIGILEDRIEAVETLDGDTDISGIGDGTITGAIDTLNNTDVSLGNRVGAIETLDGDTDISGIGDGTITGAIDALNNKALGDLSDVEITSPVHNQIIKYNSTLQKWVNGTGGGGGVSDYNDLENKPTLNGVTIGGTQTSSDLKLDGTYSTSETVVGTWVDGKPIYRKCYSADGVSISASTILDASLVPSAVTPIKITGTYKFGGSWYDSTFYFIEGSGYTAYSRIDTNGLDLVVTNRTVEGYRLEVYYTKASD